jgi:hypothetical protein
MQAELPIAYSSTPEIFDLSPQQKFDLERKANLGDNEAALRLNEYFSLTIGEPEKGVPYLRMAIDRGSLRAMWILAAYLENADDHRECEAVALYEKLSVFEIKVEEQNQAARAKAALQAKVGICPP